MQFNCKTIQDFFSIYFQKKVPDRIFLYLEVPLFSQGEKGIWVVK